MSAASFCPCLNKEGNYLVCCISRTPVVIISLFSCTKSIISPFHQSQLFKEKSLIFTHFFSFPLDSLPLAPSGKPRFHAAWLHRKKKRFIPGYTLRTRQQTLTLSLNPNSSHEYQSTYAPQLLPRDREKDGTINRLGGSHSWEQFLLLSKAICMGSPVL